jgi:hypothetical protein
MNTERGQKTARAIPGAAGGHPGHRFGRPTAVGDESVSVASRWDATPADDTISVVAVCRSRASRCRSPAANEEFQLIGLKCSCTT